MDEEEADDKAEAAITAKTADAKTAAPRKRPSLNV
jgi:hypothetical protein